MKLTLKHDILMPFNKGVKYRPNWFQNMKEISLLGCIQYHEFYTIEILYACTVVVFLRCYWQNLECK